MHIQTEFNGQTSERRSLSPTLSWAVFLSTVVFTVGFVLATAIHGSEPPPSTDLGEKGTLNSKMTLRVRLQELVIDLGNEEIKIPSVPDKVFDLPGEPVPDDKVFRGKHLLATEPLFEVEIKWDFKSTVGYLQKKLIADKELDSASSWSFINSPKSGLVHAYHKGKEVPLKGRMGIIVER